jgi:flagellar hook-length control protein FliK
MGPEPADPARSTSVTVTQAVLAESAPRPKAASKIEDQPAPVQGPKPEGTRPSEKIPKSVNLQSPVEPAHTPIKAAATPAPLAVEHEAAPSAGGVKSGPQPAEGPEAGESSALEAALAKTSASLQPAIANTPDGSSLAAVNAMPRAVEPPATTAPTAPAAPPSTPATPPSAPVVQVEGGLRWMLKGGVQEAQLQLHPDSLGQVTIHLKVEGDEVHARLWIAEPTSVQAVQEGRPHLELCLKEQGLQLGSFDLQQGRRPFQEAPSASPFRENAIPEAVHARQEAPSAVLPSTLNPHRVELYA